MGLLSALGRAGRVMNRVAPIGVGIYGGLAGNQAAIESAQARGAGVGEQAASGVLGALSGAGLGPLGPLGAGGALLGAGSALGRGADLIIQNVFQVLQQSGDTSPQGVARAVQQVGGDENTFQRVMQMLG